jgi:hypothetical protein
VLKLFDNFMISVYVFLAMTLVITTFWYPARHQGERPELVQPINRYGVVVSVILPVITLWLLVVRV